MDEQQRCILFGKFIYTPKCKHIETIKKLVTSLRLSVTNVTYSSLTNRYMKSTCRRNANILIKGLYHE